MIKKLFILHTLVLILTHSFAQRTCGTMSYLEQQKLLDPQLEERMRIIEAETQEYAKNNPNPNRSIITIPVVFHVVYRTSTENISDQRIFDQLKVLNEDFRKLNANITQVPSVWQNVAADFEIEFCLAQRDPSGNATTGITRTSTTATSFSDNDKVKFTAQGGKDVWDRSKYLNIWVCNLSNLLGYATFPGGTASVDGVVCNYRYVGLAGASSPYNKGRTGTHEIGHWLNLRHIWGDNNCGNDQVSDTPTQQAENYGCPNFPKVSCSNGPNGEMFMNYMDYSDDACMCMFTTGQKTRAQAVLNGSRASLKTSNGCTPLNTAAGVAISITSGTNPTCSGASVTFTATPINGGTAPSYQWKAGTSNVGGNNATYTTTTLTNGQVVTCVMTSNMPGVTGNPATSTGITMTVNPNPSPAISGTATVCSGNNTTLTASGGTTYSWNTGSTASSITVSPTATTTYTLTATTSGCNGTTTQAVTVNPKPVPSISGTNTICSGQNTTLTASGGTTYSWNTGSTATAITVSPTSSTTYTVTAATAGCTADATKEVTVNPTPPTPTITENGAVLTSSAVTGNQWYLNGNPISNATNQSYTVTSNGNYTVVVTISGCSSTTSSTLNVTNTGIVQNNTTDHILSIFPNPNDGAFTVSFNALEKLSYKLEIRNAIGQVVYKQEITNYNGTFSKQMNIVEYGKGLYLISLTNSNNETIKKIIVY